MKGLCHGTGREGREGKEWITLQEKGVMLPASRMYGMYALPKPTESRMVMPPRRAGRTRECGGKENQSFLSGLSGFPSGRRPGGRNRADSGIRTAWGISGPDQATAM